MQTSNGNATTPLPALSAEECQHVRSCLQAALSQGNTETQRQSEALLTEYEKRPGFVSCLAEVVGGKDEDHSTRWLAATQFKNSINRNWRTLKTSRCLSEEEKVHLRAKLPSLIAQDDNQIAVQVALVYAKVARHDYPREWPSLFSDLTSCLRGPPLPTPLVTRRVYLILHHITKELSSKRLASDQRTFEALTEGLFPEVWGQWLSDTQSLLSSLPAALEAATSGGGAPGAASSAQPLLQLFERWLLLLKTKFLRRYHSPDSAIQLSRAAQEWWNQIWEGTGHFAQPE